MQVSRVGAAFAVQEPSSAGAWFAENLGFAVLADIGWYVNTQHPQHPKLTVDFVRSDDETWVEPVSRMAGAMIALEVADVSEEHERLVNAGVTIIKQLVDEPWGQRRVQLAGPEGLVVELVQPIDPDPDWMAALGFPT